ncbi:TIGR03084 family metal-binding protein [Jhaorihella thermophila]|uniref:TIGR03084 family protein n=2 Tax=Jhaorihella thermophila TaxID=488547 RepID=A0A1H5UM42_9RHOB|nr:TIGR03084 family protein [Jhaorihella thermophila]
MAALPQAADFLEESQTLYAAIAPLSDADLRQPTQFKGWTIDDVLVHLHFWNKAADLSTTDEAAFTALMGQLMGSLQSGGLRAFENAQIPERGTELRDLWIAHARDMAARWADMDPRRRLPWAGPSMSARSSITARQMETWAHGFEVFDALGLRRQETDRIQNIVVLGVNTFGWSHKVHGLPVPDTLPSLRLTAPSGALWIFGDDAGAITGPAVDFAAVVTQTRALADTALRVEGEIARTWMENAQCFAGPPETPPAPGTRTVAG